MTRLLIADDHPMIGAALELLLRGTDYQIIGRVRGGDEAIAQVQATKPDLLLLDVNMPGTSGIDVLRALRQREEGPVIILLTAGMDDQQLLAASALEPEGMVMKTADPALLIECMDQVRAGERWIDPEIAVNIERVKAQAAAAPSLSPRERDLVDLVRRGLRNRDIAEKLGVTEGTVKVYLHAIFDKVGVENRTELAMRADKLLLR